MCSRTATGGRIANARGLQMKVDTYICDLPGCGVQKKDANHWWRVYRIEDGLVIANWSASFRDVTLPAAAEVADLCGEQHAIEWISKNLKSA